MVKALHEYAFVYDFLYNAMSEKERAAIREELKLSTTMELYGSFNNYNIRSNWATFTYDFWPNAVLEGEPDYNPWKTAGAYRAWRNFMTYGVLPAHS